ncbi:MAG: DUF664 domain-containing protein [Candidatus Eisenbacteria bacterium]
MPVYDLEIPRGRSHEAALFLAEIDDQTRRLFQDLKGITAAELAWSPKRGQNTIGMLLTHLAVVEVYWLAVAAGRFTPAALKKSGARDVAEQEFRDVLGVGPDDDGMPLAKNGLPPAALASWTYADYRRLLGRARVHIAAQVLELTDRDVARKVKRVRLNGEHTAQSVRWILYHVLEHFSGHYGQILLLRHQYADRRKK